MPPDLSSDSEVLDSTETPQQETPRTCTRQIPCCKQTCLGCLSPTDSNHIRNLTTLLNTTNSTATIATLPAPPIDHWLSKITNGIQEAILREDIEELKLFNNLYAHKFMSEPEVLKFDCSDFLTARTNALKIINSSSPVPNSNSPSPSPAPTFQTRRGQRDSTMPADLTSSDSEVLDSLETPFTFIQYIEQKFKSHLSNTTSG